MIRGTTPTFSLTITGDVNLAEAENIYVTIRQGPVVITLTGDRLQIVDKTISCWLTQEESLKLQEKTTAKVQVNWTYLENGEYTRRAATVVKDIPIGIQLLGRVIE